MPQKQRKRKGFGAAPEVHAARVAEIHTQIEQGLREAAQIQTPTRAMHGCRVFHDNVLALQERIGRAQGHLDGVAGSSAATTAMFKTQKRLASKVGALTTRFRRSCMKGA